VDGDLAEICEKVMIMHEAARKGRAFMWEMRKVHMALVMALFANTNKDNALGTVLFANRTVPNANRTVPSAGRRHGYRLLLHG
jgi:hypothetical protein